MVAEPRSERDRTYDIAVVGMAGRFPGAADVEELRRNLAGGVEATRFFSTEELLAAGVDAGVLADPRYVRARPVLDDVELFDAGFFGFNPREAQMIDPQQRLFLECAWHALESAGHAPDGDPGRIGVFAGASINGYLLANVLSNPALIESFGGFQTRIASDKDFLATRVSYKLDLKGPSVSVQTACSTSLVAVHVACQSLLNRECDTALSGGSTLILPQETGYLFQEGGIDSPDGRCRPFDARAAGTIFGSGVGVVVLKRYADAVADGDPIRAVILGSAVNNDGAAKVGFTAPSIEGQAEVVQEALAMAGVGPETITAIEAHGTATAIGDVIEVAALKKVFHEVEGRGVCALGAIKGNFGHLDSAAGVVGLIKAVLSLESRQHFPTLHFEHPHPDLALEESPFVVSSELRDWDPGPLPRRIGVSSFGIGGSNAHVVLEEAPEDAEEESGSRPVQLLVWSARTRAALERVTGGLARYLESHPEAVPLADVAHTLQVGRRAMEHRRVAVVATGTGPAAAAAALTDPRRSFTGSTGDDAPTVAFLFSGQGAQYPGMAAGLYRDEPVFRTALDRSAEILAGSPGLDLHALLFPSGDDREGAARRLERTAHAQPALFAVEHALATLWAEWGVEPAAMLGHSVGEYAAACLAGVMSHEEALALVAARGRLMDALPPGAMVAVPLPEDEVAGLLDGGLAVAAVNGPARSVVSGPEGEVAAFEERLAGRGVETRRLHTFHAFHSALMEPALEPFLAEVRKVELQAPKLPYVSNLTGTWITPEEATSPEYYARHLRHTVRFSDGLGELLARPDTVLVEIGPGRGLGTLARQRCDRERGQLALASLPGPRDDGDDLETAYAALGQAWAAGVPVRWDGFRGDERRCRVVLPGYPFERQRHWIEPGEGSIHATQAAGGATSRDLATWFHLPTWRRSMVPRARALEGAESGSWLVFADRWGLGERIAGRLREAGERVVVAWPGERFGKVDGGFEADPRSADDLAELWWAAREEGAVDRVLYLWGFDAGPRSSDAEVLLDEDLDGAFFGLLGLGQALAGHAPEGLLPLWVITDQLASVNGREAVDVARATVLGPCRVLPLEQPELDCRWIDLDLEPGGEAAEGDRDAALERAAGEVLTEVLSAASERWNRAVAYRGRQRWVETFERLRFEAPDGPPVRLRPGGVYLITGGLGSMGLAFARYLAETVGARLVLIGRSAPPPRETWEERLELLDSQDGNDPLRERIAGLLALEATGVEVLTVEADVTDLAAMGAAVARAVERFGAVHGAVHAAGVLGQGAAALKSPEEAAAVLAPKVRGSLVLDAVLAPHAPDFVLLCSSRSSVVPLPGQVDYCAANVFLDSLAHLRSAAGGPPTISVDWGFWQRLGMAAGAELPAPLKAEMAAGIERLRVEGLADAGVDAFARVLDSCTAPQVVVSRQPMEGLLAETRALAESVDAPAPRAPRTDEAAGGAYRAPSGETEERLAEIWQTLLGIDRIGAEDDFFSLGGHSLLATRLVARIEEGFGVAVPLRAIFDASTVARLAAMVEAAEGGAEEDEWADEVDDGVHPVSFSQLRLWYQHRLEPESTGYNSSVAVRVLGRLEPAALAAAFSEAVRRHEPLRTTFGERDGEPVQIVGPPVAVPLPVIDLAGLAGLSGEAGADGAEEVARIATRELRVPFDLARGPILRALLVRVAADEHVLIVEMPHIAVDAWSVAVLLREVSMAYEALSQGREPRLPELATRYADFARRQRRRIEGGGFDDQLAYWRGQLRDLPTLPLPLDQPRPPIQSLRGRTLTHRLSDELSEELRSLSRRPETTLFMVLLTAFQATLAHWTGERDVVVGCNLANRERAGTGDLVGLFLDMLVWRTDLSGDPTFLEALDRVRRVTVDAYAHADVPFDRLVQELRPERVPGLHPLFQVKFDFQNLPIEIPSASGVRFAPCHLDFERVHNDLTVYALDGARGIDLTLEYAIELFEAATIADLVARYELVLAAVATDPEVRLGELASRLDEAVESRRLAAEAAFKESHRQRLKQRTRRVARPLSEAREKR